MNWSFWGFALLCLFLIVFAAAPLIALSFKDIATVTYLLAGAAGVFLFIGLVIKRQQPLP